MQEPPPWAWAVFAGVLVVLLAVDLWVHRGGRSDSKGTAIGWTVVWIAVGLGFIGFVWPLMGPRAAQEYLAAYLIEKSLSLDNLFVFLIIFRNLHIPAHNQRTALSWGIFGALVFRAIFVLLGVAALEQWQWIPYVFAAILLYAAWHAFREDPAVQRENKIVKWLSKGLPVSADHDSNHFFQRQNGRLMATPLLIAVLALETTDIIFAIDSVPAALSLTRSEFLVYSSNAFAILGLRALYIVLAHTIADLKYLHYGLAAVLAFTAAKMALHDWIDKWLGEWAPLVSVAVIVLCVGAAVWASVLARPAPPVPEDTEISREAEAGRAPAER